METQADDNKLKNLLKQALMEALEEKKDVVRELLMEAMEDVALVHAIQEGEGSGEATRGEILGICTELKGLHEGPVYQKFCQGPAQPRK